ncbi:CMP-sialic acid transporter 4 [Phytophthora cinnamomi]|uniref:CMP-sialic acid transporter 4 n=1 Tax=Phytophthora cinnamomi TaxID=4785 RepID=UPI00355A9C04|nr:CMP-sialic acid transporter 4 [Phytophthora cinnamomi]
MLALMLVAAVFLCSGNLCIIASKVDGLMPYSSVTVTFLIEVVKLAAMLAAIVVSDTPVPNQFQLRKIGYYAVPALLNALESNLNYVVLRYLDAATVSVLWNLKILLTAVLFRYVLKSPLSELHKLAIGLLVLGVLTSQSDRFKPVNTENSQHFALGLALALVGVTLSSCASVFAEWTLKRQSDCPFLWQSLQMYGFGVLFNAVGLLVHGKALVTDGFFHGYSGWTVIVVVVNSIGGIFMACILKYLDNIACVYSHSMAMMLTTLLSMMFFAFSPSLEFACGLGVLVISMYLYHHPLAQVVAQKESSPESSTSNDDENVATVEQPSLQLKQTAKYKEVPRDVGGETESCRLSIAEV